MQGSRRAASFGSTLRVLRFDAGLSLRALAREVGVSSAYLSRVENGHDAPPTPDRLVAIAAALELPPNTLVELAQQTAPAITDYMRRVPGAASFFLEVARRNLDADQIARLRAAMDVEFERPVAAPVADEAPLLSTSIAGRIALDAECADMEEVIARGVELCAHGDHDRAARIVRLIRSREAASSTVLGNGVAVPHAVVADEPASAALVLLREPLLVGDEDPRPVELAVVLLHPTGGREHLQLLAQVARLARFGGAGLLAGLRTPAEVADALARIETQ